jgi:hypothetical protein
MGELDRFELVKSLQRCVKTEYELNLCHAFGGTHGMHPDCSGSTLTFDEMDAAVKLVETAEAEMAAERFPSALSALSSALAIAPNFSLALFKAGLCVLAGNGSFLHHLLSGNASVCHGVTCSDDTRVFIASTVSVLDFQISRYC